MTFKMTLKQKSILTVAFLLMSRILPGQIGVSDRINQDYERGPSFEALEQAARNEVERGNYFGAMRYYKTLLKAEPLNARVLAAYGEAAVSYAALDSAEVAYQTIVDNKLTGPDGYALLRLAEVKYRMGKYAEASKVYSRFLFEDKPAAATESSKLAAEKRLEDCEWAVTAMANPVTEPDLFNLLDSNINTPQFSEHAPYLLGDRLYFSSPRFPFLSDKVFPRRSLNKVMSAGGPLLTEAAQLISFNEEDHHITHTTFNSKGDVVYYSRCEFIGKSYDVN
jgi:tetratricopeptide (TPR) repeat protein